MLVKGVWETFADGIARPVIYAGFQAADGSWPETPFLLDSGADRTVLEARLLPLLLPLILSDDETPRLSGVDGLAECRFAETRLGLIRDDGQRVTIKGRFGLFTSVESSDISILGRDVTNNFDVIYSFPKQAVRLLTRPHDYVLQLPF